MTNYNGKKCIVRTYSAGVHFGEVVLHKGKEVELKNAIRIWSWSGAASLSQMAMQGVKNPRECKFAIPVDSILLTESIELIPCSADAIANIEGVPAWKV